MAVNFSVPDDVKAAFDRTFKAQNKGAVIARSAGGIARLKDWGEYGRPE